MASEPAPSATAQSAPWPPAVVWAVRIAIIALALYNLWDFLDWLPSFSLQDMAKATFHFLQNFVFTYIINPLASLAAIALAVMNRRLKLAALLAAVPTIHFWLNVLAFGIGVAIYGF